jgi:hypothetical protein
MKLLFILFFFIPSVCISQELIPFKCEDEFPQKNIDSIPLHLEFLNQGSVEVKIYRKDIKGDIFYKDLSPTKTFIAPAHTSQIWKVKDHFGKCLMIFHPIDKVNSKAVIKDNYLVLSKPKNNQTIPAEEISKTSENNISTIKQEANKSVVNDDASNAKHLIVNANPYRSNTTQCTLEEKCINRLLTSKCLVYHNDQWFTFTTSDDSLYYIIIKNQNCRDINGVQLLVLDGILCQPSTYELMECVSTSTQDDIFVTLRKLKSNHTYIINLDGYLNDFCDFEIGVSSKLPDFNVDALYKTSVNYSINNGIVKFDWKLSEELQNKGVSHFEINRRFQSDKKYLKIKDVEVERTVDRNYLVDYTFTDTLLKEGTYHYKVVAVSMDEKKFLIDELTFKGFPQIINPNVITLDLGWNENTKIKVEIYNWLNHQLLNSYTTKYTEKNFSVDLNSFYTNEVMRLKVIITDSKGRKREQVVDKKFK